MQARMFFLRRTRPLELTAGRMRALRVSLNTPVVATQELPVGPARAAILIHAEPRGGLAITVGVRSLACGSIALYGFEGAISSGLVNEVMDAALSFAEGMGFLFDDELIGNDTAAQEKALVRWHEAIGQAEGGPPADALELEPVLELFDLEGGDLTDPPVSPEPPASPYEIARPRSGPFSGADSPEGIELGAVAPAFEPAWEVPATLPLTKFRVRADTPPAPKAPNAAEAPNAPKKRPLGRVQLTRRRPNKLVQDARRSWLLRLLTSF
jgi:hypothetical protein